MPEYTLYFDHLDGDLLFDLEVTRLGDPVDIDRPTLIFITVIAALVGGWAAWSAAKAGQDAASVGGVVYAVVAGVLAKLFGGSAFGVLIRSLFLLVGGVFAIVASVLLGGGAGIHLTPTTN